MVRKCSTDERFIRKRNTAYKIHTLEARQKFYLVYQHIYPTSTSMMDMIAQGKKAIWYCGYDQPSFFCFLVHTNTTFCEYLYQESNDIVLDWHDYPIPGLHLTRLGCHKRATKLDFFIQVISLTVIIQITLFLS